ncbi:hypothetical protein Trydic_g6134 [Trypoxylus dichotomus]
MIEKVRGFITSSKMVEEDLNISKEAITMILHENFIKTRVCTKFILHALTDGPKWVPVNHSREVVAAARNYPKFPRSIVTNDGML